MWLLNIVMGISQKKVELLRCFSQLSLYNASFSLLALLAKFVLNLTDLDYLVS
jgi:hypothetical protein